MTVSEYTRSVEKFIPLSRVNGVRCQLQPRLRPVFEYNTYVTHMIQKNKKIRILEKFVKYVAVTRMMRIASRLRRKAVQDIRRLYIEYLTRKRKVGKKRDKKVRLISIRIIQAWSRKTLGKIAAVRKTQVLRKFQKARINIQRFYRGYMSRKRTFGMFQRLWFFYTKIGHLVYKYKVITKARKLHKQILSVQACGRMFPRKGI